MLKKIWRLYKFVTRIYALLLILGLVVSCFLSDNSTQQEITLPEEHGFESVFLMKKTKTEGFVTRDEYRLYFIKL